MRREEACPWRRFFARSLDLTFYEVVWGCILLFILNINWLDRSSLEQYLDSIISMALMLFIEPVQLALFGTTLGKWTLGIQITDKDGKHLSYLAGLNRTWGVVCCGCGFNFPLYRLYRLWKSYKQCRDRETLEWSGDTEFHLRDEKGWRIGLYLAMIAVAFGISFLICYVALMPRNRGNISAKQFCANYNQAARYCNSGSRLTINENGKMEERSKIAQADGIEYSYTEKDGVITGMSITLKDGRKETLESCWSEPVLLCVCAFLEAQRQYGFNSPEVREVIKKIATSPYQNVEEHVYGIKVTYESDKYRPLLDDIELMSPPSTGKKAGYAFSFKMEKE